MSEKPKQPFRVAVNNDRTVEIILDIPEESDEASAERKARSAKCGHVKRRLNSERASHG
jgi:hypothetical protein